MQCVTCPRGIVGFRIGPGNERCRRSPPEETGCNRPGREFRKWTGQSLVRTEEKRTAWRYPFRKACDQLVLERMAEIGERDVATEDKMEGSLRNFAPQVLTAKLKPAAQIRAKAVHPPSVLECSARPGPRKVAQGTCRKASEARSRENVRIHIGAEYV